MTAKRRIDALPDDATVSLSFTPDVTIGPASVIQSLSGTSPFLFTVSTPRILFIYIYMFKLLLEEERRETYIHVYVLLFLYICVALSLSLSVICHGGADDE